MDKIDKRNNINFLPAIFCLVLTISLVSCQSQPVISRGDQKQKDFDQRISQNTCQKDNDCVLVAKRDQGCCLTCEYTVASRAVAASLTAWDKANCQKADYGECAQNACVRTAAENKAVCKQGRCAKE